MRDTDRFARLLQIKAAWRVSLVEEGGAEVPRVKCQKHGVILLGVPRAEGSARYTTVFGQLVNNRLKDTSTSAVAQPLKFSWSAVTAS